MARPVARNIKNMTEENKLLFFIWRIFDWCLTCSYQIIFQDFFLFLVLIIVNLPRCETLLQNVKRRIFFCPLSWNIVRCCKYPEDHDHPNYPPNEVHSPIITAVKHDYFYLKRRINIYATKVGTVSYLKITLFLEYIA